MAFSDTAFLMQKNLQSKTNQNFHLHWSVFYVPEAVWLREKEHLEMYNVRESADKCVTEQLICALNTKSTIWGRKVPIEVEIQTSYVATTPAHFFLVSYFYTQF